MNTVIVQRTKKTVDGILGTLTLDFNPFTCFTIENLKLSIPSGTYPVSFLWSGRFKRMTPHIQVPKRTNIEIHNANYPNQLEGCIAVGDKIDGDAVDDSVKTDQQLEAILKLQNNLKIQIIDIPS